MNIVLSVYASKAFREFLLPPINNADTQIILRKEIFSIPEDLCILLEVVENAWYLKKSEKYTWKKQEGENDKPLQDGDIINLKSGNSNGISLIVRSDEKTFSVYQKYDISDMENITIGNGTENLVQYQYLALVSKQHAIISKNEKGLLLQDISTNGTFVNDKRVEGKKNLETGDCINIFGLKIIVLKDMLAIGSFEGAKYSVSEKIKKYNPRRKSDIAKNLPEPLEKLYFHRAPRSYSNPACEVIEIEAPPVPKEEGKRPLWMVIGPSFTMILPMLTGSLMSILASRASGQTANAYMYTGMVTAIGSALIGIYWAVQNIKYNRVEIQKGEQLRFQAYGDYLVEKAEMLREYSKKEKERLFALYPEAKQLASYGWGSTQLWNRNCRQDDFLSVRIGLGILPFPAQINVPKERFQLFHDELSKKPELISKEYKSITNVPINVNLYRHKLIGIVGGTGKQGAFEIVRLLTAQIAANNCYTDVKLVFVYDEDKDAEEWGYAKWLPHVWSEDKKTRYIAGNKTEASDVLFELTQILRGRAEEENRKQGFPKPYYILVISDAEFLESELIEKYVYECNPSLGLTTLILAESREQLPNECEYLIEKDEDYQGLYDMAGGEQAEVSFDAISSEEMEEFSRRLLAIEVRENEKGSNLVSNLSFMEMWGVGRLEELQVADRWRKHRTYDNMRALIGQKAGGMPCYLDVHEKYHGPHGLVAGTTGSGKSETLQTYLLSLAINFSPDDVAFFIIDYKGGGMAGLFEGLPHLIGSVSNLSGNQVRRAMISIKSENRRRQRLFNDHNVNNINLYTKLFKNGEAKMAIPHLFIIIDEFAELKREEPEFMKELISVAQVGRSLGVHLILATQKPHGVVDENIWSNSKFRLCLRVQDKQDSNDMLHKPDAAYITQAGRGYLQVGNDEVYELFQSGYSGAAYDESHNSQTEIAEMITLNGKAERVRAVKQDDGGEKKATQLEAVIQYLKKIASKEGYEQQMQLWRPPLPTELYLESLSAGEELPSYKENWMGKQDKWELSAVVGLCDDPANQEQPPLVVDFSEKGHLAVCGTIVSGKSTFLQTLLYALVRKYSPAWLNLYIIDFSSNALGALEDAPQVGGVLYEDDADKLEKLFYMLHHIMEERRKLLRGGNYVQYVHANGVVLPAIVLAIDNFGGFREKTEGRYDAELLHILKAGVSYGVYLAVTAAGFGTNEITIKMGDNIKNVICLQMNDKFAYVDALRNNQIEILPEGNVKGRGLAVVKERVLEFQTALAKVADDDFMRLERIKEEGRRMAGEWEGVIARKIPYIPENPKWKDFIQDGEAQKLNCRADKLAVGWDMKSAEVYGIPLNHMYSYIVSGPERSGKTNFLKAVIEMAMLKNGKIVIIEHGSDKYEEIAQKARAEYITNVKEQEEFFRALVEPFRSRNQKKLKLLEQGMEEEEIFEEMKQEIPYFIIIDDLVSFLHSILEEEKKNSVTIRRFVENVAERGRLHNIYFFLGLNPDKVGDLIGNRMFRGFTSYRTGICFGGNVVTPTYFEFTNLSREDKGKPQKAGIGLLAAGNEEEVTKIRIPLLKE